MQWWFMFTFFAYALAQTPKNLKGLIDSVGFSVPSQSGTTASAASVTPAAGLITKLPAITTPASNNNILCGTRNPDGLDSPRILGNKITNVAEFGEFPWMVIVLRQYADDDGLPNPPIYQCGGSLIHPQVVLTATHCVRPKDYKYSVRAGEWNMLKEDEFYAHQERGVEKIIIHPDYYSGGFHNDIALLILVSPFDIEHPHIQPVCLPRQGQLVENTQCFVTGWGMNSSQGDYQGTLKKANLPIMSRNRCEENVKKVPGKDNFVLHQSFICAGGEVKKDACKGDGGGPLVCRIPNMAGAKKRYFQAGIVSWGIGCGQAQVPGLYADVTKFVNWINSELAPYNLDKSYYTY